MLTTKVCQINNWVQSYFPLIGDGHVSCYTIILNIPEALLNRYTVNPTLPLVRLIRDGKILGGCKSEEGIWQVKQIADYQKIASVRQIAYLLGYMRTKPLYSLLEKGELPSKTTENGHRYFVVNEIIEWAKEMKVLPFHRKRFSLSDTIILTERLHALYKELGKVRFLIDKGRDINDLMGGEELRTIQSYIGSVIHDIDGEQGIDHIEDDDSYKYRFI